MTNLGFIRRWSALTFVSVVAAAVLLSTGSVHAASNDLNKLLKGDYAFSGSATCLVSRGGFNANLTPAGSQFPFVISFSVQGVRTFNADGTGSVRGRSVSIGHPFALPSPTISPYTPSFNRGGASSSDFEGTFTYEVAPDRTFTVENVTLTGTALTGTLAGQTFEVTNFPKFFGGISKDGRTLTLAHEEPTVETQTFLNGQQQVDLQYRICHRARILLEYKGDN